MPDRIVKMVSDSHTVETILGALMIAVSFLFKRALSAQDKKIEDNRREIREVNERNRKDIQDLHDRNRQTDQNIAEIHSNLSFIKGYLTNSDSENP